MAEPIVKQTAEQHKKALEKQLWNIANALRGNMSADEFRDYILGFIFYKYLSERMHQYADGILAEDGLKFDAIDESTEEGQEYLTAIKEEAIDHLGYFLKPSELFHVIAESGNKGEFIIEALTEVLNHIEQSTMGTASEDDFNGLFDDIDLTSNKLGKSEKQKNDLITTVLGHLDEIDFCLDDTEIDVLGDAYEYLIGQFASGAGKKAGEFYTPPMVSKLLAKLVTKDKTQLKSVYDPTCGSGSLLLQVSKEIHRKGGEVSNYYGQEKNPSTYNLARMNMILHGVHYRSFDIQQDDTLETPHHIEKRFSAVVANPPFSSDWSANDGFKSDERFADYGKLAPKSKADFAFVQHMLHQLDDNGTMAVVLPHGVLFRGAAEGHIRKYLIEQKNCLDAVIGLPANIFYGTSIPTCILVLKKQRKPDDRILFIDASKNFGKTSNKNYLRDTDLDKILTTYTQRASAEKYSSAIDLREVAENAYSLSLIRYVDTFDDIAVIDLSDIQKNSLHQNRRIEKVNSQIQSLCAEVGSPFIDIYNIEMMKEYKLGMVQHLLTKKFRFKSDNDKSYPDWKQVSLGSIANVLSGGGLSKSSLKSSGKNECILYGELFTKYKEVIRGVDNRTNEDIGRISIYGDILMPTSDVTPNGLATASVLLKSDVLLGGDMNIIRLISDESAIFISYLINNMKKDFMRLVTGTTIKHIYAKDIKNVQLYLPSSQEEQSKIANLCDLIDRKIELLEKPFMKG